MSTSIRDIIRAHQTTYSAVGWGCTCGHRYLSNHAVSDSVTEHLLEFAMAQAWDGGFDDAEYQDAGFLHCSGWARENPYRAEMT